MPCRSRSSWRKQAEHERDVRRFLEADGLKEKDSIGKGGSYTFELLDALALLLRSLSSPSGDSAFSVRCFLAGDLLAAVAAFFLLGGITIG